MVKKNKNVEVGNTPPSETLQPSAQSQPIVDRKLLIPIMVRLIEIGGGDELPENIAKRFNIPVQEAKKVINKGWEKIRLAATSDRQKEMGLAKKQLEMLFETALKKNDLKTALSTRADLSKLLHLYDVPDSTVLDETLNDETERLAREHLESLNLFPPGLPLDELCRQVSLYILNK